MHRIIDLIKKTEDFFILKEIQNPRFEAELLLAEALNLERLHLYTQFDRILTEDEVLHCRRLLKRFKSSSTQYRLIELKEKALDELIQANVENAKVDLAILLEHCLKIPRLELSLHHEKVIPFSDANLFLDLVRRRKTREPLQYILGSVEFYALEFLVNKHVLIPRSETEQLLEFIIKKHSQSPFKSILDIGTGSGCIPIVLKKHFPETEVTSIDKFIPALTIASKNMNRHDLEINLVNMDFLENEAWENLEKFDMIVSNPPYITLEEYEHLEIELTKYEPKLALTDNSDGLSFYRKIVQFCEKHLSEKGYLYLEHGDKQQKQIIDLLAQTKYFSEINGHKDLNNFDRFISARKK